MKGKTHSTEEIIRILRQADGGETAQAICREHNISEQIFNLFAIIRDSIIAQPLLLLSIRIFQYQFQTLYFPSHPTFAVRCEIGASEFEFVAVN